MRGFGGRAGFTTFARFFTGSFLSVWLFCFVCFWLFVCGFSASQPVKRLLQVIPVSPFLLSHISRVDRPCSVLARQCRKKNWTAITSPDQMSRRYCNLCEHQWYSACLAPCVVSLSEKDGTAQQRPTKASRRGRATSESYLLSTQELKNEPNIASMAAAEPA